jgi:hypothetical protein
MLASRHIAISDLDYDEVLFVNAAISGGRTQQTPAASRLAVSTAHYMIPLDLFD